MNLRFCPKCGNEVIEGANFCLNCGTNFQELRDKKTLSESSKTEEVIQAKEVEVVDTVKPVDASADTNSFSSTGTDSSSSTSGYTGFENIDSALGRAFAEMDKIYFDMVNSSEPMETTIINTMINMRSCNEQLVRFLINKVGLTDNQVLAGAKAKNSSYNDKNTVDAMSQILALNFYGFIPANIEDTMHDVRMCGNEAAHRSTGPNNKTYNFYNKTPEQIKKYAIEMHDKLDIIKSFVLKNYEEVFLHPSSGSKGFVNSTAGAALNASVKVRRVAIFITFIVAIVFGVFIIYIVKNMSDNMNKQKEYANAYSQAVNNNNNNVDETAIRNAAIASVSNAASTYQVDYSVKMKNQFKAADMKKTALNEIRKCNLTNANIITVKAGQTTHLTGNNDYYNSQDLICASSNKNVATINWAGVIKGVKKGTCVGVIRNTSIQKYTWFIINVE